MVRLLYALKVEVSQVSAKQGYLYALKIKLLWLRIKHTK